MNKTSSLTSDNTLNSQSKVSEIFLKATPFFNELLVAIRLNNKEFAVFVSKADTWNKANDLKINVESIVRTLGGVSHGKK
jgi:uncharacterized protein YciU (UPF0263 family)